MLNGLIEGDLEKFALAGWGLHQKQIYDLFLDPTDDLKSGAGVESLSKEFCDASEAATELCYEPAEYFRIPILEGTGQENEYLACKTSLSRGSRHLDPFGRGPPKGLQDTGLYVRSPGIGLTPLV